MFHVLGRYTPRTASGQSDVQRQGSGGPHAMVDSGLQAALLVVGVFFLVVMCTLFRRRPRPEAYSHEELNQIRIDRELATEVMLEEKAQRLTGRARVHRHNRMVLTACKDTGRLLQGAQERWDAKGRSIYGDAWDDPQDGNLPLRTLFNLPREEIESIREEASRLIRASPATEFSSLPFPPGYPEHFDGGTHGLLNQDLRKMCVRNDEHRAMTASARRGPAHGRQLSDAPFVDTRFVHVPAPPVVPPLDLTGLNNMGNARNPQTMPRLPSTAVISGQKLFNDTSVSPPDTNPMYMNLAAPFREEHHRPAGPATTTIARGDSNPDCKQFTEQMNTAPLSSFQDPGLIHPKPPDVPLPRSKRDNYGIESKHESLSARLARLAAGGNSRRVVPVELV